MCGVDHTQHIKIRKLSQPSKKLNCPIQFSVNKFNRFLECKISEDTSWQRSSTLKKSRVKKATFDDNVPGYLEYVTKFPKGHSLDFLIYHSFISVSFITGV